MEYNSLVVWKSIFPVKKIGDGCRFQPSIFQGVLHTLPDIAPAHGISQKEKNFPITIFQWRAVKERTRHYIIFGWLKNLPILSILLVG